MRKLLNLLPGRRRRMERELEQELSYHIDRRIADLKRSGLDELEARRRVAIEFGPVQQIGEDARDTWVWRWLDEGLRDFQSAVRSLRRGPSVAFTAILTLGLGIGASAAIFSVVNAVLLRPLPYGDADRLVLIWSDLLNRGVRDFGHPPGDLYDLRQQTTVFDGLASVRTNHAPVTIADAEPERVPVALITPDFFSVIGATVVLGSDFVEADGNPVTASEQATAMPLTTILSHEFWQRRFGGRPDAVGSTIQLGVARAMIVGVAEPHLELLFPPDVGIERTPAIWIAQRLDFHTSSRTSVDQRIVGRLRPGVTVAQAQEQVNRVTANLRRRFPIKDSAGLSHRVEPMHSDLVADVRAAILVLMGAAMFLLLIACANVANLQLIRAAEREREFAIRAAIGGSRNRIVRQLVVESLVMSAAGVMLGVGIVAVGVKALLALSPSVLPRLETVSVDWVVVTFASLTGVFSALLFGIAPALRASRPAVIELLRTGGRSTGPSGARWLRNTVVVGEVALSLVLLIGAGLMVRTFTALINIDPGFNPTNSMTFTLSNAGLRDSEGRETFMRQMHSALRGMPAATHVTAAGPLPLDGNGSAGRWGTLAALADPAEFQQATYYAVLPGYFEAVGATLLEGRTFVDADNTGDRQVVIVDDVLAAKGFGTQSPIGQQLLVRRNADDPVPYEVVGVVRHQRHASLSGERREALYLTDGQMGHAAAYRWVVRTVGNPTVIAPAVREAVHRINPQVIVAELQPWTDFVDRATAPTRFALFLISVFAGIAMVLATVGLYGVLSTAVRQRTSEIGVRVAFGASAGSILRLVLLLGTRLTVVGVALGLAIAAGTTRMMQFMLVGVTPTDPMTFAAIALGFLTVAAIACALPARRAARMNPMFALREGQ